MAIFDYCLGFFLSPDSRFIFVRRILYEVAGSRLFRLWRRSFSTIPIELMGIIAYEGGDFKEKIAGFWEIPGNEG